MQNNKIYNIFLGFIAILRIKSFFKKRFKKNKYSSSDRKILIEFNIGVFISLIKYATENKIDDIKIEYDKLLSPILYFFFMPLSISLYVKYNSETPKNIDNKSSDTA